MTASLSGVFNVQQLTDAGLPAAGYRLYTYAPSTTTQKVAYTDAAASVPHTYVSDGIGGLYIALNARGELPAPLFLQLAFALNLAVTASGDTGIQVSLRVGGTVARNKQARLDLREFV